MDILKPALARLNAMGVNLIAQLPNIIIGLLVFGAFYAAGKVVRSTMRKVALQQSKHLSLGLVLGRLAQGGIIFVGLLVAMVIALPSFQPAQLVQVLGISGVAIGFAFKDILQNFLAGILLLLTEPFRIGDQIRVADFEGTVEDIQTRATFIKTYDGRRVVIPNGELFNQSVTVNTAYAERRLQYDFGIGFGDDIETARNLILGVLRGDEQILRDPAPDVLVLELGASSVNLRARWWINPPRRADEMAALDRTITRVKNELTAHGIDLPFPTQQILFHDQTEVTDGDRAHQREGWPAGKGKIPLPRYRVEDKLREDNGDAPSANATLGQSTPPSHDGDPAANTRDGG